MSDHFIQVLIKSSMFDLFILILLLQCALSDPVVVFFLLQCSLSDPVIYVLLLKCSMSDPIYSCRLTSVFRVLSCCCFLLTKVLHV